MHIEKKLGVSLNNFNDKINGKLQFTEKEIRVFFDDFGYQIFLPVLVANLQIGNSNDTTR